MKEQNKELLYLDGMWLRQEHLLNLAMGVGNYAQAEHYLFALLADAVVKGRREAILEGHTGGKQGKRALWRKGDTFI